MEDKKKSFLLSKTFWAVVITAIIIILEANGVNIPEWLITSLLAGGLLLARFSKKKLK